MTDQTLKPSWKMVKSGDVMRLNTDRIADPLAAGIERYVGPEHKAKEIEIKIAERCAGTCTTRASASCPSGWRS